MYHFGLASGTPWISASSSLGASSSQRQGAVDVERFDGIQAREERGLRLGDLTRAELMSRAVAGATCLLPVGSLEQHGDHLPISTDSLLAEAICLRAAELSKTDAVVAPVLWTGFSPHHVRFGATVTLTQETMLALVREVTESLRSSFERVLIIKRPWRKPRRRSAR